MSEYHRYWGDTHHNSYQHYVQDPPLAQILDDCCAHLDFYTGAYYTPAYEVAPVLPSHQKPVQTLRGGHLSEQRDTGSHWAGVHLEGWKDPNIMAREWAEFQAVTEAKNHPGEFVALPGYEWQGNARWGDHNVIYGREGPEICTAATLPELYRFLCELDVPAIAIPHHTAYYVTQRAPTWSACDERLSPFAEIYSIHGCSETDEEWVGLRHNSHMGPGVGGGTYQEALDQGLHLGAICSSDNWTNMPGRWGHGLMCCLSKELTREGLWEAFLARRVYGVTGDRIAISFTCNGAEMGARLANPTPRREFVVHVGGADAIDRIELLRNGRVVATHCHQGTWTQPKQRTRFKLRIEAGWGPRLGEIPLAETQWEGKLFVAGGRFVGWEPCWITRGQGVPRLDGETASFLMLSRQENVPLSTQGGTLFEVEADPEAELVLDLNGLRLSARIAELAEHSHLLWYREDAVQRILQMTGVEPAQARRGDAYYQLANKAKVHRAIPEQAYTAELEWVDDEPLQSEANYRVRVEQRNGQRAWTSPIWVQATEE